MRELPAPMSSKAWHFMPSTFTSTITSVYTTAPITISLAVIRCLAMVQIEVWCCDPHLRHPLLVLHSTAQCLLPCSWSKICFGLIFSSFYQLWSCARSHWSVCTLLQLCEDFESWTTVFFIKVLHFSGVGCRYDWQFGYVLSVSVHYLLRLAIFCLGWLWHFDIPPVNGRPLISTRTFSLGSSFRYVNFCNEFTVKW